MAKAARAKKKKFFATPKHISVTVVLLKNYQTHIPRGESRQWLVDGKRVRNVELHRQMSPEEVKDAISGTFGCTAFTVLRVCKGWLRFEIQ